MRIRSRSAIYYYTTIHNRTKILALQHELGLLTLHF